MKGFITFIRGFLGSSASTVAQAAVMGSAATLVQKTQSLLNPQPPKPELVYGKNQYGDRRLAEVKIGKKSIICLAEKIESTCDEEDSARTLAERQEESREVLAELRESGVVGRNNAQSKKREKLLKTILSLKKQLNEKRSTAQFTAELMGSNDNTRILYLLFYVQELMENIETLTSVRSAEIKRLYTGEYDYNARDYIKTMLSNGLFAKYTELNAAVVLLPREVNQILAECGYPTFPELENIDVRVQQYYARKVR